MSPLPASAVGLTLGRVAVISGPSMRGRRAELLAQQSARLLAGCLVLQAAAQAHVPDTGALAVYEALLQSPRWTTTREYAASLPTTAQGWAGELLDAAGGRDFLLAIDSWDGTFAPSRDFFRELAAAIAQESGLTSEHPGGRVLLNPRAQLSAAELGGMNAIELPVATTHHRAHPLGLHLLIQSEFQRLTPDGQLRDHLWHQAMARREVQAVDGRWLPRQHLSTPVLPLDDPELEHLQSLDSSQWRLLQALSVLGTAESSQLVELTGQGESAQLRILSDRHLIERCGLGWRLSSELVRASLAQSVGAAQRHDWRGPSTPTQDQGESTVISAEKLADTSGPRTSTPLAGSLLPPVPAPEQVFQVGPALDTGAQTLEWARWAWLAAQQPQTVGATPERAAQWAALAAIVLARRGQLHRAQWWLSQLPSQAAESLGECLLRDRARQLSATLTLDLPRRGYFTQYADLLADFQRLGPNSAAAQSELPKILQRAAQLRAVVLWGQAAQLARQWQLPVGPGPSDDQGRDDLQSAILSILALGHSTAECADWLGLSRRAIEKRISGWYAETSLTSRAALIAQLQSGKIPIPGD